MAEQTDQVTIPGNLLNELMACIQTSPTGKHSWQDVQNLLARVQQEANPVVPKQEPVSTPGDTHKDGTTDAEIDGSNNQQDEDQGKT